LVAPVEFALRREPPAQRPFLVPIEPPPQPPRPFYLGRQMWIIAALAVCVVVLGWLGVQRIRNKRADTHRGGGALPTPEPAISPLMGLGGEQRMPAFSPDGSRIAFLLQTSVAQKSGIYVMVSGSQSLLQLTSNPSDSDPAWSPDGRFIAFLRNADESFSIWLIPTLGGTERRLYTGVRCPWEGPVSLSFARDGQHLAFAEWNRETQQNSIKLLALADLSIRSLTTPPQGYHDSAPAFSPKGNWLAFVRWTGPIF